MKYGQSFLFPTTFRFPMAEPVNVRLRVSMNTPGRRNGKLDVLVQTKQPKKYQHVVSRTGMEWRADARFGIDSVLCEKFHGVDVKSWAPRKSSFALLSRLSVRSVERRKSEKVALPTAKQSTYQTPNLLDKCYSISLLT